MINRFIRAMMFVAVAGLVLAGCDKGAPEADAGKTGAASVVNSKCPMMAGRAVSADTKFTRTFQGMTVGFCCAGCPAKWDALSDEEKTAKLAGASRCSGEADCSCPLCGAAETVQCTGQDDCQCPQCAEAEVVQCTRQDDCQCPHCAPAETVQCTRQPDCQCSHCAS